MDKYLLTMNNKFYSETTGEFIANESEATKYDTSGAAGKKRRKLYKKVFGNIGIKIVHIDEEK